MIVCQANLGRGVTADEYRRNLRRVLAAFGPRALYALQEIDEADKPEELDILAGLVRRSHRIVGGQTAVPILVPRHLELLEESQEQACEGLAKFTPARQLNEALMRVGPNLTVAALDLHFPIDRPQTQSRRQDCLEALQERARERKAQGHAGVWLSDTNWREGWPRIVHGEKTVTAAGIDRAKAWAPPGRRVVVQKRQTVRLTIDGHDAHGAQVLWIPRGKAA